MLDLLSSKLDREVYTDYSVVKKIFTEEDKYVIREVNIVKSLSHPNVVKYISYNKDKLTLSTEYSGITLTDFLKCNYPIGKSGKDVLDKLSKDLLSGLSAIHNLNIIHRDIKPDNLVVDSNNLKICDFGSAIIYKKDEKMWTGYITLPYRAPELIFDFPFYDMKVDVWSAGCVIYEIYNRKQLFNSFSEIGIQCNMLMKWDSSNWPEIKESKRYNEYLVDSKYLMVLDKPLSQILILNPKLRPTSSEARNFF